MWKIYLSPFLETIWRKNCIEGDKLNFRPKLFWKLTCTVLKLGSSCPQFWLEQSIAMKLSRSNVSYSCVIGPKQNSTVLFHFSPMTQNQESFDLLSFMAILCSSQNWRQLQPTFSHLDTIFLLKLKNGFVQEWIDHGDLGLIFSIESGPVLVSNL